VPTAVSADPTEQVFEVADLESWRRVVSSTLAGAQMLSVRPAAFEGRIRRVRVGDLALVDMTASAHVAKRSSGDNGGAGSGYVLSLQLDGSEEVVQGRRRVTLAPGDFTVYDASRPFLAEGTADFRCLNVQISSRAIGLTDDEMRSLVAQRIGGTSGLAPVVGTLLVHASDTLATSARTQPRASIDAARHTVTLIGDLLRGHLEAAGDGPHARRAPAVDVDRVVELMIARLGEWGVTAEQVAADAHVSLRQLHRLFESRGESFGQTLRRLRLERAAADLRSPELAGVTVAEIGARWGFATPAHFSQTFRRSLGVGPAEFRRRNSAGRTVS
jgi:AraC-like DNA-binding protein